MTQDIQITQAKSVVKLIGDTKIIQLNNFQSEGNLFAKIESSNPGWSVKDRIAKYMIEEAEKEGVLKPGSVIIEPTSGNTGIGLALISASKGYKLILTLPETMSVERQKMMKFFGAEIILTDGKKGMKGAIEKALEIQKETGGWIPNQFENPANPKAHFETTGPEIWEQTGGEVDIFVAGVGTGGTITGVGKFLKSKNPNIKTVAVEPEDSPVLSGGNPGPHKIQGIGAGFIPKILDVEIIDEVRTVKTSDAIENSKKIAKIEGIGTGISGGAALTIAKQVASENPGKKVVTLLPDTNERYLSTVLFEEK
jgi:cysteine synthase A